MKQYLTTFSAAILILTSCQKSARVDIADANGQQAATLTEAMVSENGQNPDDLFESGSNRHTFGNSHVYIESNEGSWNTIIVYEQQSNGKLQWVEQVNSGGRGAGSGLGSQGALALDRNNSLLFAVNAGSNSVSSFKIKHDGKLELMSTASSQGERPVSVTVHGQYVYVVNGISADIAGFKVNNNGQFYPITGSLKTLSSMDANPAEIAFSPDGNVLLVTEKGTNSITAFPVNAWGGTGNKVVNPSVGNTPFGFDFARGRYMIVTNADGGNANTSTCTSYRGIDNLQIYAANGKVSNGQTAVCWVATTEGGRYAFTANTGSNTLTGYYIDPLGRLYRIPWVTEKTGEKPADVIVSYDNQFVYNINGGTNTLGEYKRKVLGGLQNIGYINSLPDFAAGLVSF